MKRNMISLLTVLGLSVMTLCRPVTADAAEVGEIVQLDCVYSYDEMCLDLTELVQTYPDFVSFDVAGYTACGRVIPYVILGNKDAPKKILVTSTIHAREYLNSQSVMKMVEYYASGFSQGMFGDMYASTAYYIIPMCNPDGVCMVQGGASEWKANANGVDLNRNFSPGWELTGDGAANPGSERYKGAAPETEPEVQAMLNVGSMASWNFVLNYHQRGNVNYCGSALVGSDYNNACMNYSRIIASVNGYKVAKACNFNSTCYGTFGDYAAVVYGAPYVTVETGTGFNQGQVRQIYNSNQNVFYVLSQQVL